MTFWNRKGVNEARGGTSGTYHIEHERAQQTLDTVAESVARLNGAPPNKGRAVQQHSESPAMCQAGSAALG